MISLPLRRIADAPTFRAFGYRNFRYLWLGQVSNSASVWTEQVARPLLVIHLVPDPAQAALHIGLVLSARALPQLGFGLIGGVFADWFDRRRLLRVSWAASTSVQVVMAVLLLLGLLELWHVYATTVLRGIALSFDQPARQAMIPSLVPPRILVNAVALNAGAMQVMRIGGAPLAGLLIVAFGFGGAFVAVAIFSAAAFAFTFGIEASPRDTTPERSPRAAAASFREGLRYGWAHDTIRGPLLLMCVHLMLGMTWLQVFAPLVATHVLGVGGTGYALMVSAAGMGALIALLLMASLPSVTRRGTLTLGAAALMGILLMAYGASTYLGITMLTYSLIALVGFVQTSVHAMSNTLLMETALPHMRGRIMGLLSFDRSLTTLGGVTAGVFAATIGPQLGQVAFGAAVLASAVLLAVTQPGFRRAS